MNYMFFVVFIFRICPTVIDHRRIEVVLTVVAQTSLIFIKRFNRIMEEQKQQKRLYIAIIFRFIDLTYIIPAHVGNIQYAMTNVLGDCDVVFIKD